MSAQLIDGVAVAATVRAEVAQGVQELVSAGGRVPGLATVLVGEDPASQVYVRNKRRACVAAGMRDLHQHVSADASSAQVQELLLELAADEAVSGILLQLPLPSHLQAESLIELIPAEKDVDGLTSHSAGLLAQGRPGLRPCTPSGVMSLLHAAQVPLSGANAVVVGRSSLVGRPMAQLLLQADATVTTCHSRTRDLAAVCRTADVLVVAAGIPSLIGPDAVAPGAVVVDVGIHRTEGGLVGDVQSASVREVAGWLTPVPGGVGPMTIAMLLSNTLRAAHGQLGVR